MESVLLYYPFQMAENANSGSKLRPIEIHRAFLEWGKKENIEILLLSGNSNERAKLYTKWKAEGKLDNLLFCYMENQTIPLWLTDEGHIPKNPFIDYKVMSFLKKKGIPVGVFYRDVYWKFPDLYPLKGLKRMIMQTIYKLEEKFYQRYCDVVFLPSNAMGSYVSINKSKVSLPPGGKRREIRKLKHESPSQAIYVGGINNEDYGLFLLLDALKIANRKERICQLTVVCREQEFQSLDLKRKDLFKDSSITICHVSGNELDELYKRMDFAFIPRYKSVYNDFSVPVKLVEYLSNELPVIATNCDAQKEIIESGKYGLICMDNPESMAIAIQEMNGLSEKFTENIQKTFINEHSWEARVKKVKQVLLKEEI